MIFELTALELIIRESSHTAFVETTLIQLCNFVAVSASPHLATAYESLCIHYVHIGDFKRTKATPSHIDQNRLTHSCIGRRSVQGLFVTSLVAVIDHR